MPGLASPDDDKFIDNALFELLENVS